MPPTGYYKRLLPDTMSHVRFAFTHSPIIGLTIIDSSSVLEVLSKSTDPWAEWYSDKIKEGSIAVGLLSQNLNMNYSPGELFLRS
jgi:hypothetical protein